MRATKEQDLAARASLEAMCNELGVKPHKPVAELTDDEIDQLVIALENCIEQQKPPREKRIVIKNWKDVAWVLVLMVVTVFVALLIQEAIVSIWP